MTEEQAKPTAAADNAMSDDPIRFEEDGTTLLAYSNLRSGMRIDLLDADSEDPNWRCFHLAEEQAEILGKALLRWAAAWRLAAGRPGITNPEPARIAGTTE